MHSITLSRPKAKPRIRPTRQMIFAAGELLDAMEDAALAELQNRLESGGDPENLFDATVNALNGGGR